MITTSKNAVGSITTEPTLPYPDIYSKAITFAFHQFHVFFFQIVCYILNDTRAQPEEGVVTPPQQQRKLVELPPAAVEAMVDEDAVTEVIEVPGDSGIGATYKLEQH